MRKRIYRTMSVNAFQACSIRREAAGARLVVGVDIAKVDMVAAFAASDGRILTTVRWKAPAENATLLGILRQFRAAEMVVEVVMEPSGTYGDVLRQQLQTDGFPVFMVNGKRTFDAKELYDGVPSLHDAKSAAILTSSTHTMRMEPALSAEKGQTVKCPMRSCSNVTFFRKHAGTISFSGGRTPKTRFVSLIAMRNPGVPLDANARPSTSKQGPTRAGFD